MSNINENYTALWTCNKFTCERVVKYNNKFKIKWEKNIKHKQQIRLIKKYLELETYWCDFPIGSGRLMDELYTSKRLGVDISEPFLEYNRNKGIVCSKGDLLDNQYLEEFDLVTSMHTIAAFTQCKLIIEGYIRSLKSGGVLIVDIPHQESKLKEMNRLNKLEFDKSHDSSSCVMSTKEIISFFNKNNCEILEMQPHDFWDHPVFIRWKNTRFRREIWGLVNRLYFSKSKFIAYFMFNILNGIEKLFPLHRFTKYLLVVKKN